MAIDFINGVWTGYTTTVYKSTEATYRAGIHRFGTAVAQLGGVNNALDQISEAIKAMGFSEGVDLATRVVSYVTPTVASILCATLNFENSPHLKRLALTVHNAVGIVCYTAVLVASV